MRVQVLVIRKEAERFLSRNATRIRLSFPEASRMIALDPTRLLPAIRWTALALVPMLAIAACGDTSSSGEVWTPDGGTKVDSGIPRKDSGAKDTGGGQVGDDDDDDDSDASPPGDDDTDAGDDDD